MPERPVVFKLREGTEVLRTGGGATLSAADCTEVLDKLDELETLCDLLRQSNGSEWRDDDPDCTRVRFPTKVWEELQDIAKGIGR